ncbi:MAG: hypothetical protein LM563_01125 [Thermofilum sp.]|nr:hypothetical protein [Thermofilum sp.]MCC6058839.1 hypothetical protein [Thermofilum sp.]
MKEYRQKLARALDLIDEAIDILRECAREDKVLADMLEDVLYNLEEAGEQLSSLVEKARSE